MKLKCIGVMLALALSAHESHGASGLDIPTFGECAKDADVIVGDFGGSLDIKVRRTVFDVMSQNTQEDYVRYDLNSLLSKTNPDNNNIIKVTTLSSDQWNNPDLVNISIFDSINLGCVREHNGLLDYWRVIIHSTKYHGKIGIDAKRVDIAGNVTVKDLVVHSSEDYVSNLGKLATKNCKILSKYIANHGSIKILTNFFQNGYVELIDQDILKEFSEKYRVNASDLSKFIQASNLDSSSFSKLLDLAKKNALKDQSSLLKFSPLDVFQAISQNAVQVTQRDYEIYQSSENKRMGFFNADYGIIEAGKDGDHIETRGLEKVNLSGHIKVNKWISDTPIRIGSPLESTEKPLLYDCSFNYLSAPWISVDTVKINRSFQKGLWSAEGKLSIKHPDRKTKVVAMSNKLYDSKSCNNLESATKNCIKVALSNVYVYIGSLLSDLTFDVSDSLMPLFKTACKSGITKKLKSMGFDVKDQIDTTNQCREYNANIVKNSKLSIPVRVVTLGDKLYYYDQDGTRYNSAVISKIWHQTLLKKGKENARPFENIVLDIAEEVTGLSRKDFINQLKSKCTIDEEKINEIADDLILKAKAKYDEIDNIVDWNLSRVIKVGYGTSEEIQRIEDFQNQYKDSLQCLANFLVLIGLYKEGETIQLKDILDKSRQILSFVYEFSTFSAFPNRCRTVEGFNKEYKNKLCQNIRTQVEENLICDIFSDIEF